MDVAEVPSQLAHTHPVLYFGCFGAGATLAGDIQIYDLESAVCTEHTRFALGAGKAGSHATSGVSASIVMLRNVYVDILLIVGGTNFDFGVPANPSFKVGDVLLEADLPQPELVDFGDGHFVPELNEVKLYHGFDLLRHANNKRGSIKLAFDSKSHEPVMGDLNRFETGKLVVIIDDALSYTSEGCFKLFELHGN